MKRVEPSVNILHKQDYRPSWSMTWKRDQVPYLGGHIGLVRRYRDAILRNTQTLSHGPDTPMDGRIE